MLGLMQDQPLLIVVMMAAAALVGKWWLADLRQARIGLPSGNLVGIGFNSRIFFSGNAAPCASRKKLPATERAYN